MINLNPELILMHNDEITTEKLAKQHDAKEALKLAYSLRAANVGMTLGGYCKRFNIKLN